MNLNDIIANEDVEQFNQLLQSNQVEHSILLEKVIKLGKINLLKILIEHNIDLDQNINNDTPLTLAIRSISIYNSDEKNNNITQIVILLIESGADINQVNRCGIYPVLYACNLNSMTILDYLLKLNVNLNVMDYVDDTPLHYAAYNDYSDITKRLLTYKVNINYVNDENCTPLNNAIGESNINVAKILIEAGANISPLDLKCAIYKENKEMINLLIEYGVDIDVDFDEDMNPELVQHVKEYADSLNLIKEPAK